MDRQSSRYDSELQMFTHPPREPNPGRLRFLRWLCEVSRLEHEPAGAPTGPYAVAMLRDLAEPGDGRRQPAAPFLSATR
jgi:hypothetical protein